MPPEVAVAGLLAVLALGAGAATLAPRLLANVMSVLIVTVIMCTRLYTAAVPPRYLLLVFLALGAVGCRLCIPSSVASRTCATVMVVSYAALMMVVFLEFRFTTASGDAELFSYLAIVPMAGVFGYFLVASGRAAQMARAFLVVAAISAALAFVERATNGPIFGGNPFEQFTTDGEFRAAVFSEHALVLASLFLSALPMAFIVTKGLLRTVLVALMLAGIATTFSRGALGLGIGYVVAATIWATVPGLHRYGTAFRVVLAGLLVAIPLVLFWQPFGFGGVTSADPSTASVQYRGAIYPLTIRSLEDHPLGWGLGGPTPGEYTFQSPFGVLDISESIDSELVQTMMEFGYPGAIVLAGIAALAVSRLRSGRWWSHVALLITAAGFYLSIHAWVGLLGLWALAIGATLATPPPDDAEADLDVAESDRSGTTMADTGRLAEPGLVAELPAAQPIRPRRAVHS